MRRTLEAIFRRLWLLLLLIVLLPSVSIAVVYFLPRTYRRQHHSGRCVAMTSSAPQVQKPALSQ